jgi:transposase-like protein
MVRSVVEGGLSHAAAARQFNTTPKTVAKWVKRFRKEGVDDFAGSVLTVPFIDIARNRQPYLAALGPQQALGLGAGRTGESL